jgi:hypothetical protein
VVSSKSESPTADMSKPVRAMVDMGAMAAMADLRVTDAAPKVAPAGAAAPLTARGGRRTTVFSTPVSVEAGWVPRKVAKTDTEKDRCARSRARAVARRACMCMGGFCARCARGVHVRVLFVECRAAVWILAVAPVVAVGSRARV